MRIFKRTFRDRRTGETKQTKKWYVEFYAQAHDLVRQPPAFTDKGASEVLGQKCQLLSAHVALNQQVDVGLQRWLDALPASIQQPRISQIDLRSW